MEYPTGNYNPEVLQLQHVQQPNNEEARPMRIQQFMIYCFTCKKPTITNKELTFKRNMQNRYYVSGCCMECGRSKVKQLNANERQIMFKDLLTIPAGSSVSSCYLKNGQALPLSALIPVLVNQPEIGSGVPIPAPTVQDPGMPIQSDRGTSTQSDRETRSQADPTSMLELLFDGGYSLDDIIDNSIKILKENGFEIMFKRKKGPEVNGN